MESHKINKIKSIGLEDFKKLWIELLGSLNYVEIQTDNSKTNFISASEISALRENVHVFYLTTYALSGSDEDTKSEVDNIINELVKYSRDYKNYIFFIVSTNYISKGTISRIKSSIEGINVDFKDRDAVIHLIDLHAKDYWRHDDLELIKYETKFIESIEEDTDLKKLKIFNEKYDKVLKIFIEPKIYSIDEDIESKKPTRKRTNLESLTRETGSNIISGDAGCGKSTILKKVGEKLIELNKENNQKKNLPIYISSIDFIEIGRDIEKILKTKVGPILGSDLQFLSDNYNISIIIDSLDELDIPIIEDVMTQLSYLERSFAVRFFIGARNSEKVLEASSNQNIKSYQVDKFNQDQIKRYIDLFFPNNSSRAESLIDALRENRILERLPITPLTLSLVSILFEEKNFEIPATIADIYENFNHLLLGKATASSRIEFIDISFTQRILSLYAFELLHRENHVPHTISEFHKHFKEYFAKKESRLGSEELEKLLNHIATNSGILEVKDGKYVQFKHNSFLEYYAAQEYFKYNRNDKSEQELVDNFFKDIWQNTSIFYGGMSKDMPEFLKKIIGKISQASLISDVFSAVNGIGYLLQALYQTDNNLRKEAIEQAIETNIESLHFLKKLAQDQQVLFKNHNLPILTLMNMSFFYENFNSIALKTPLELAFDNFFMKYIESENENDGYRSLKIALTLNSRRLNSPIQLERLILESRITSSPYLSLLGHFAIDMGENSSKDIHKELEKTLDKNPSIVRALLDSKMKNIRFGPLDSIRPKRSVMLIVEGKTDVQILEHAYFILTNGERPYWNIDSPEHNDGGARAVCDVLNGSLTTHDNSNILIGILDNDSEGIKNFNGHVNDNNFKATGDRRIKKGNGKNVYAIRLPIPQRLKHYRQDKQELNFFEIEHYLPLEYLQRKDRIKETGIPDVYEIKGRKNTFASEVLKETDQELFRDFIDLFRLIDSITGREIEYIT